MYLLQDVIIYITYLFNKCLRRRTKRFMLIMNNSGTYVTQLEIKDFIFLWKDILCIK